MNALWVDEHQHELTAPTPGRKSPKSWKRGLWVPKSNPLHFQDWGILCGGARSNTCIQAPDSGRKLCSQEVMLDFNSCPFSVPPNLVLSGDLARLRLKPSAILSARTPSCGTPLADSWICSGLFTLSSPGSSGFLVLTVSFLILTVSLDSSF